MKSNRTILVHILSALAGVIVAWVPARAHAYTYFIDEPSDYPANACGPTPAPLDYVAGEIVQALNADGWTGSWYGSTGAFPTDFVDSAYGGAYATGHDSDWADAANLAVFLGHGDTAKTSFAYPDPYSGSCETGGVSVPNGFGMGKYNGRQAAIAVYGSCCTLNPHYLGYMATNNGTTESLGFGNVVRLNRAMFLDFYERTQNESNVEAWFEVMETSWDNSPVALVAGNDANHAAWLSTYCQIRGDKCNVNAFGTGSPYDYWYWWLDHGTSGCSPE